MIKTASSSGSRPVVEPIGRMVMPQQSRMDSAHLFRSSRDFESLKTERARLETFSLPPGWPVTFISREDCAKAGFFYLQDGDKVQCAFCRGVAGEWEEGDNPSTEHRRHFPRCPYVCNLPVGNTPIDEHENDAAQLTEQEVAAGVDVCGPFVSAARFHGQEPASVRGAQPLDGNMNDVATSLAIQVCGNGPMHKNLVTYQSRVKSFTTKWPTSSGQTPESLAEAGFAYLGHLDHVKCFYCDGGLRNWEPGDDPWLEHARWFPNCSFVILNKGGSDEESPTTSVPKITKLPLSRSGSGDSGVSTMSSESGDDQPQGSTSSQPSEETPGISSTSDKNKQSDNSSTCKEEVTNQSDDVFSMKEITKEIELEEELRKLREATQCKICMDNRVEVVFLPCGHLVSCTRCATALSNCAVCRQPIKAYVKTYLS